MSPRGAMRRAGRLAAALALAVAATGPARGAEPAAPPPPADAEGPEAWAAHWASLAALGEGFVVWESNRTGSWRLWTRRLDGSGLRQLTPDDPGHDHIAPHVSPDGRQLLYLRTESPQTDFKDLRHESAELRLLRLGEAGPGETLTRARPNLQNRAAVWVDSERFIFIDAEGRTAEHDLRTGRTELLTHETREKFGRLVNAQRTHAINGHPTFSLYDAELRGVHRRRRLEGCQPYFSDDGRYGYYVAGAGGPFVAFDLRTRESTVMLARDASWLPRGRGYVYYPMVSRGRRLLAFAASRGEHGHFEADFDVFVAPLDPESLAVVGTAVRYSFDPATDRFPDVFLAGSELGEQTGEAPLRVRLATPPEPGPTSPWRFDFGDGSPPQADAVHVFTRPGEYLVRAERGSEVLRGRVVVAPPSPPRPLRVEVPPGRRRLRVVFDEPIAAPAAQARLASGAAVRDVEVASDGRSLQIELAEALPGSDTLHLAGVVDRSDPPRPMASAELPVRVAEWPRYDDGLLFLWERAGEENLAPDPRTGAPEASEPERRGRARFDAHGAAMLSGGALRAVPLAAGSAERLHRAGAVTLELTVEAEAQGEPDAHVAVLGSPGGGARLTLVVQERLLVARARGGGRSEDVALGTLHRGRREQHLVVSVAEERLLAWLDGERVADAAVPLRPDAFGDDVSLVVGADFRGGHDFDGTVEGVALYARAFEGSEAAAHANLYMDRVAQRKHIPRYEATGRVARVSEPPTLAEIAPYREALVLDEYRVLDGDLAGQVIRVAHWAILDGSPQPASALREGEERPLVIEPWEAHPLAEGAFLADTLDPDPTIPLYVDVSS